MMRKIEIEAWTLRVIEQCQRNQHTEDGNVELKAEWPPAEKAARQIAGLANAARGEPALLVIGADEEAGLTGADPQELSDWWAKVRAEFDHVHPPLQDVNVAIDDKVVVALVFETDRAPYVVRNAQFGKPGAGPIKWEAPWREGRGTRTARREDLVRMLAPFAKLPEVEPLKAVLRYSGPGSNAPPKSRWNLLVEMYLVPAQYERFTILFHRCSVRIEFASGMLIDQPSTLIVFQAASSSSGMRHTNSEAVVSEPAMAKLDAMSWAVDPPDFSKDAEAQVSLALHVAGADRPILLPLTLQREAQTDIVFSWRTRIEVA